MMMTDALSAETESVNALDDWMSRLHDAFGVEFVLWPDEAGRDDLEWAVERAELATVAAANRQPELLRVDRDRCLIAVPYTVDADRAATAVAPSAQVDLLRRLGQQFLNTERLRGDLNEAEQVSDSMALLVSDNLEEMAFIRRTTQFLQLPASVNNPLHDVADLLAGLRKTVHSESLVLVLEAETEPDGVRRVIWDGPRILDNKACGGLREFCKLSSRPFTKNEIDRSPLADSLPGVRELVIANISLDDDSGGYLAAINRSFDSEFRLSGTQHSEHRFGTVEATIVDATASALSTHIHNIELLRQKDQLFTEVVRALVNAVEARDPYTCGHSQRVALFSRRLGQEVGLSKDALDKLYLSGLLHDVGKIAISDATLLKSGQLTDKEFEELKGHPERGWAILHDLEHLRDVMPGVLHHHERYDGEGYPDGLAGEGIPLEARVMAICDAYDAMTSDRPYRKGMPQSKAEAILEGAAGTQWDPALVVKFFEIMPEIVQIRDDFQPRTEGVRERSVT